MLPSRTLRSFTRASLFSTAIAVGSRPAIVLPQHPQALVHAPGICTRLSPSAYFSSLAHLSPQGPDMTAAKDRMAQLQEQITPSKLEEVVEFWFEHFTDAGQFVAPPQQAAMRWFKRDEELDRACVAKFGDCLEVIRATEGVTTDDLLALIDQAASLDWVGLVLLLDQIPRNIYRGEQSRIPFTVFDPIAQGVVKRALEEGIFDREDMRRRVAYRSWFLFPFMHSEDAGLHASCVEMCEALVDDAKKVSNDNDRELAVKFAQTLLDFEKRHQSIIDRFGRYPHRNKVLGRQSTTEEEAFLRDGGDTFGG